MRIINAHLCKVKSKSRHSLGQVQRLLSKPCDLACVQQQRYEPAQNLSRHSSLIRDPR